jgi:hypothetical protein
MRKTQVRAKKPLEVLRRRPAKKPAQHLSAKNKPQVQRSRKHPVPPELGELIATANKVPDGLPSLRDLRDLAQDAKSENPNTQIDLDSLIWREVAKMPESLKQSFPEPPDMLNEQSRLYWRVRGRQQLQERYDYLTQAKLTLVVIANSDSDWVGPFYLESWLYKDKHGKAQFEIYPILQELKGVELARIRQCPICQKIYWAERKDQPACEKRCNNIRRSRIQRGTFSRS